MKKLIAVLALAALGPLGILAQEAKDIYLDECAVCHGADGAGKTAKGRKLKLRGVKDVIGKMGEEEMIKIVNDGKKPDMDGYSKKLNAAQVKAVVAYYRALAK